MAAGGILRVTPDGRVVHIVSGLTTEARINLDPDGNVLVADPSHGVVWRISVEGS